MTQKQIKGIANCELIEFDYTTATICFDIDFNNILEDTMADDYTDHSEQSPHSYTVEKQLHDMPNEQILMMALTYIKQKLTEHENSRLQRPIRKGR